MIKLNIVNKILLKAMLLPAALYRKSGANTRQLQSILEYKLMMDDRRPNTLHQTKQQTQEKPISGSTVGMMLLAVFMGLIFIISFFISNDILTSFTIFFSMYIIMLALTLITDFTSVLIDVRDNLIILPKPVNDATFVIARIIHISIHVFKIMLPMALPGLVTVAIKYGGIPLISFFIMVIASALFTIFLINALYIFVLRVSSPEKFKNIISYIQIAFAILIYGSYQILPRMMDDVITASTSIGYHPGLLALPPYWFGAAMQQLIQPVQQPVVWIGMAFSILMPVIGIVAVVKFFAPTFNQKLSMIATGTSAPNKKHDGKRAKTSYSQWLASLVTPNSLERQSFLFSWKMMLRNRDYKLKVYPGIGYMLVILVMMFIRTKSGTSVLETLNLNHENGSRFAFLAGLYFTGLVSMTALQQFVYSEHFKASWIFGVSPLAQPGRLIAGATKATIAHFQLPMFLIISIILLYINGWMSIPHILLAFTNLCLLAATVIMLSDHHLPWSMAFSKNDQGGTVLKTLLVMLLLGATSLVHGLLAKYLWAVMILLVLSAISCYYAFKAITELSWKKIRAREY